MTLPLHPMAEPRVYPTLDVSQASDGRGVVSVTRLNRLPVPVAAYASVDAARRALKSGPLADFDRLVRLIPTNDLSRLMECA